MKRSLTIAVAVAVAVSAGLVACDVDHPVSRPGEPLVLTGADLPDLVGEAPDGIVAFRYAVRQGAGSWHQLPVQVDERKVVGFGTQPASNATPGVMGTVYGSGSAGVTALQYADPNTFVGADADPTFDADDELVFMVDDAGREAADGAGEPGGVVGGSGVAVQVDDPQTGDEAWVYLFVTDGSLDPSGGFDYVDYRFQLTSGDYRTTYKRRVGPNPETSEVVTDSYRIGYSDRWYEDAWQITAGSATGVDILDGHKNQFATTSCVRSNKTFADEEGAFVANVDGPVRGIRSYIGANSGPLTQRTHFMYRASETVVTDLRVHAIPGMMDFIDYSSAAVGMTYRSSTLPGGVVVDGVQDTVPSAAPTWESVSGAQGTIVTHSKVTASFATSPTQFYRDQTTPSEPQCWGDGSYLGASGASLGAMPNTDPAAGAHGTLQGSRTTHFLEPAAPNVVVAVAEALAADQLTPVATTVTSYTP